MPKPAATSFADPWADLPDPTAGLSGPDPWADLPEYRPVAPAQPDLGVTLSRPQPGVRPMTDLEAEVVGQSLPRQPGWQPGNIPSPEVSFTGLSRVVPVAQAAQSGFVSSVARPIAATTEALYGDRTSTDLVDRDLERLASPTLSKPGWQWDPQAWAELGAQAAGSIAGFALMTAGGDPGAMLRSVLLEAGVEASNKYADLRKAGYDDAEAKQGAILSFAANAALLRATNIPLLNKVTSKPLVNALLRTVTESTQEGGQEIISNVLEGRDWREGVAQSMAAGALGGAPMGLIGERATTRPTLRQPEPSVPLEVQARLGARDARAATDASIAETYQRAPLPAQQAAGVPAAVPTMADLIRTNVAESAAARAASTFPVEQAPGVVDPYAGLPEAPVATTGEDLAGLPTSVLSERLFRLRSTERGETPEMVALQEEIKQRPFTAPMQRAEYRPGREPQAPAPPAQEVPSAAETRIEPEGRQPEYPRAEGERAPAGPGRSDRPLPGPPVGGEGRAQEAVGATKEQVFYHGTNAPEITTLRPSLTPDDHVPGISVTDDVGMASTYGKYVLRLRVRVTKPIDFLALEDYARAKAEAEGFPIEDPEDFAAFDVPPEKLLAWLKADGYDAIDYRSDPMTGYGLRVFSPDQITVERPTAVGGEGQQEAVAAPPSPFAPLSEQEQEERGRLARLATRKGAALTPIQRDRLTELDDRAAFASQLDVYLKTTDDDVTLSPQTLATLAPDAYEEARRYWFDEQQGEIATDESDPKLRDFWETVAGWFRRADVVRAGQQDLFAGAQQAPVPAPAAEAPTTGRVSADLTDEEFEAEMIRRAEAKRAQKAQAAAPAEPAQITEKAAWEQREDAIAEAVKASKAQGRTHLDDLPMGVEALRGRRFRSLRDDSEWIATTVDNRGTVYFVSPDGEVEAERYGRERSEFVLQPTLSRADLATAIKANTGKKPSPKQLAQAADYYGFPREGPPSKPAPPPPPAAPRLTYEEFKAQYTRAFEQGARYKPNEIGFKESAEKMAALADAYPEYQERIDAEAEETPPATRPTGPPLTLPTVTFNAAGSVIKVAFPKKPAREVLDRLKEHGFRWAKANRVWYHKDPQRLTTERGEGWQTFAEQKVRAWVGLPVQEERVAAAGQQITEAADLLGKNFDNLLPQQRDAIESAGGRFGTGLRRWATDYATWLNTTEATRAEMPPPIPAAWSAADREAAVRLRQTLIDQQPKATTAEEEGFTVEGRVSPRAAEAEAPGTPQVAPEWRAELPSFVTEQYRKPEPTDLEAKRADAKRRQQEAADEVRAELRKMLGQVQTGVPVPTAALTRAAAKFVRASADLGLVDVQAAWREFVAMVGEHAGRVREEFAAAWEMVQGAAVEAETLESETVAPAEAPSVAAPAVLSDERVVRLYQAFSDRLRAGTLPTDPRGLRALAQEEVGGDPRTYTDEITDAVETALTAMIPPVTPETFREVFADAQRWEGHLPRAARSLEKTDLQQFSTPLPIAVAAARAAEVRPAERVLEPTAGTGHLVAAVPRSAAVDVTELSARRATLLRALGRWNVSQTDYLADTARSKVDVIITNPPWGKYSTGKYGKPIALGFTPNDVAERFVAKNVRDLAPGGRLVAVMPTTMLGVGSHGFRRWLQQQGRLTAIIQSPPGAYDTRSTSVDSLLVVFDKVAPDTAGATLREIGATGPQTWEAYTEAVERIPPRPVVEGAHADTRRPADVPAERPAGGVPPAAPVARPGRPSGTRRPGPPGERPPAGVVSGREPDVVAPEPGPERAELDTEGAAIRPGEAAARESARDGRVGSVDDQARHAADSLHFAPYRLRSELAGARHPKLVIEAKAMAGVPYPPLTVEPFPRLRRLVKAGRLSVEQAEQALAAVQANIVHHHGYLAADNVGVGKSREIAAVLLDLFDRAKAEGRELRLMVTTKSRDNVADLIDKELLQDVLGGEDPGFEIVRVMDLPSAKTRAGASATDREPLPKHRHAIYVIDFFNLAAYRDGLLEVGLHGIVGDEAHRFRNTEAAVGATWQSLHAAIMRDVPRPDQVFAYFTATPAQSVYDYQYLYGLRFWPVDGFGQWVQVVTGQASEDEARRLRAATEAGAFNADVVVGNTTSVVGGDTEDTAHTDRGRGRFGGRGQDIFTTTLTPAEAEQIPREWKMLGRFSARDLWREGTEFVIHTATLPPAAHQQYDEFASLARDVMDAADRFGRMNKAARSGMGGVKSMLQFAAKRLQMQPALDEAITLAQRYVASGHQVVLSILNVSEVDPEGGRGHLQAAINMINTREIEIDPQSGDITTNQEIPEALIVRAELLERATALGVLDSPVDRVSTAFGPDQVAFIIGGAASKARQSQIAQFQAGERKVALLSAAGSTGISLDDRNGVRRVFIDVQYEWSAIEALQRYGRVDRASQVSAPIISPLTFGNAIEKKFLATIANRMAATGALSRGGAETTGAGALEEFEIGGDDILQAARDVWEQLSDDDKAVWSGPLFQERLRDGSLMPRHATTARMKDFQLAMLWVPIDRANAFWTDVLARRDELRAASNDEVVSARTLAMRGEVQREVPLSDTLTVAQVKNDAGHRFGILQGVVMPEMPRLRAFLTTEGGQIRRRYITFSAGDRIISGLEVPVTRIPRIAELYGKLLRAEKLDTPEKVRAALRAGDRVPLVQETAEGVPWELRQRKDDRIAIGGAKMADRALLLRHGATYEPVGNYWHVVDLDRFLERFPARGPEVGARSAGSTQASIGAVAKFGPGTSATIPTRTSTARPVPVPELVELAQDLQRTPTVVRKFRGKADKQGEFSERYGIRLHAGLFRPGREHELAATLAHEIGHLIDWLPDRVLTRGNLLGRLQTLRRFLKHTFTGPGGAVKLADVKRELQALSDAWRPWDPATVSASFAAYRRSASELYADALSVLLNDPGRVEREAPTFYRAFFDGLPNKPDVEAAYFDLQQVLSGTPEEITARRRERVQAMYARGEAEQKRLEEQRRAEARARRRISVEEVTQQAVEKHAPFYRRVKALEKQGIAIPEDADPRYALEERAYLASARKAWLDRHILPIRETLAKAGVSWDAFGEAMFYERILGGDTSVLTDEDWRATWEQVIAKAQGTLPAGQAAPKVGSRAGIANPLGITPEVAQQLHRAQREALGDAKWRVLQAQLAAFRAAVLAVAEEGYTSGLYTDEQHERIQSEDTYATFRVIEHLDNPLTSRVVQQIGTLKDVANVATATVEKALVTLTAAKMNAASDVALRFLEQHYRTDVTPAKTKWDGRRHVPLEPKTPDLGLVTVFRAGKQVGFWVPTPIAQSLTNYRVSPFVVAKALRAANNRWLRPVFTSLNLGFQTFNLVRDFVRTWKNTPGLSLWRLLRRYRQAHPFARARAFGPPTAVTAQSRQAREDLLQAEESRVLSATFNDLIHEADVEDTRLETLIARAGLTATEAQAVQRHVAGRIITSLRELGDYLETLPKGAAIMEAKGTGQVKDLTPAQRSHIRRKIGSPDYLAGGTWKPVTNEFFLFSNAILQAWRADLEIATDPKTRAGFWWKTAAYNLAPKLLMAAATYGWLADDGDDEDDWKAQLHRFFRAVSEYDLTNYLVIPLGWHNDKPVYLRLPQDDTGRTIGGIFWKAIRFAEQGADLDELIRTARDIFAYSTGQLPTVNPILEGAWATVQYASGQNPYDLFRGRPLFTDEEMRARDWATLGKFLRWQADNLGLRWATALGDLPRATEQKDLMDYVTALPVLGRWVKVSDYGETERLREAKAKEAQQEARERRRQRKAVTQALKDDWLYRTEGERTAGARWALARTIADDLYPDLDARAKSQKVNVIQKQLAMGALKAEADPVTEELLTAGSNRQKAAVLKEAKARMTPDEWRAWVAQARQHGVLSPDVERLVGGPPSSRVPVAVNQ